MDGFCYIQTNFKKTDAEGIYGYYNFIEWLDSSCYNPVFDSLRKKKWLYPRFNEGCSHFSFCNDMCYIFFVPGFTCLVSLMIVRIADFVINS